MSRSSPRSESARRRRRRGQTEPTAALAAAFAVVLGLAAYAVVLAGTVPGEAERALAGPTLERTHDRLVAGGVVLPGRLPAATRAAGPDGYAVNATVSAAGRAWTVGPAPPSHADRASRPVAVSLAPGRVRAGGLRVAVWS